MSERLIESVSAMMDNEVDTFELRRVLSQIDEKSEAADIWRRYHLQRDLLKGDASSVAPSIDISAAVMAKIDDLPALEAPESVDDSTKVVSRSDRFWKSMASMSVAATVTAVAIFGIQYQGATTTVGNPSAEIAAVQLPPTASLTVPSALSRDDFIRASTSTTSTLAEAQNNVESDAISRGLTHYLSQHQYLLQPQQTHWTPSWLPEGFASVRHERTPLGEVMLYTDGKNSFSISVENLGDQRLPEGTATISSTVAVTKVSDESFVTVVGDVPLVMAERIATSLVPKKVLPNNSVQ